jgi:hypothetical protein
VTRREHQLGPGVLVSQSQLSGAHFDTASMPTLVRPLSLLLGLRFAQLSPPAEPVSHS